jgi:hypothetical protein
MMNVSDAFKQAVDSLERSVVAKLEIYFDGENNSPTIFNSDMIIDFKILEEASADSQNPLGVVSSNELTISLHNKNSIFTISNVNSPYYSKIQKNILVKPYIGVILEDDSIEYIQMGEYWTDDWKSPSDSLETSATAYDRLYGLGQKDTPDLPVMVNIDIKYVFLSLFLGLGLNYDDFIIDRNISQILKYVWLSKGTVKNTLQALCTVGNCTVSMNRKGKIYVKSNNTNNTIAAVLRDSTHIKTAQNIQTYNSAISKVNLTYNLTKLSSVVELLSIKDYKVKIGVNYFKNISFNNIPVYKIENIILSNATYSIIKNIKHGSNNVSFDIVSTKEEVIDISITGIYIVKNNAVATAENNELISEIGEVNLDISSDIIQNINSAERVCKDTLNIVSMKNAKYTLATRGNPALELTDNIILDDPSDKIYNTSITILRQEITWDGSLSIDLEGRLLVSAFVEIDSSRRIGNIKMSILDSKRIIGIRNILSIDSKRVISSGVPSSMDLQRDVLNESKYTSSNFFAHLGFIIDNEDTSIPIAVDTKRIIE